MLAAAAALGTSALPWAKKFLPWVVVALLAWGVTVFAKSAVARMEKSAETRGYQKADGLWKARIAIAATEKAKREEGAANFQLVLMDKLNRVDSRLNDLHRPIVKRISDGINASPNLRSVNCAAPDGVLRSVNEARSRVRGVQAAGDTAAPTGTPAPTPATP